MAKKEYTAEEIYTKNKKRVKILRILTPICFWGFLVIGILCLCLAIRYSAGNIVEILNLLDDKVYTGEQLEQNYAFLVEKYGELGIGNGGAGFTIRFINIGKALFSAAFIFYLTMAIFFVVGAFILGKWVLPKIANHIETTNQDMVNITVLRNSENKK